MEKLIEAGEILPDDPNSPYMKCTSYLKRLVSCKGPKGMLKSYYRTGTRGDCERESIFLTSCVRAKISTGKNQTEWWEKAQDRLKELDSAKSKRAGTPVWNLRENDSIPSDFHDYQLLLKEDEIDLLNQINNS